MKAWLRNCCLLPILLSAALSIIGSDLASAQGREMTGRQRAIASCQELSIFWPLWSALSPHPWTPDDVAHWRIFPRDAIIEALHAVPLSRPLPPPKDVGAGEEYYSPAGIASNEYDAGNRGIWLQTEVYAKAASAYEAGDFAEAIRQFDAIVADRGPYPQPAKMFGDTRYYRAAAAYSAARAAFRLGNYEDGVERLDKIFADKSLEEFWAQAWDLIPRINVGARETPLDTAIYLQISRVLTAPSSLLCSSDDDPQRGDPEEKIDIGPQIIADAYLNFPTVSWRHIYGLPGMDYAKTTDPVIELLAVLPDYFQFETEDGGYGGYPVLSYSSPSSAEAWTRMPHDPATAAQARKRWGETRNPLWALALARFGGEQDLPALARGIEIVRALPEPLTEAAKADLVWAIAGGRARILLIAGKPSEALAAMQVPTSREREAASPAFADQARDAVLNSGIRFLLARGDVEGARHWAEMASPALHWPVDERIKPLLARNMDDLYTSPTWGLARIQGFVRLKGWRHLLDGWSSNQLIEFSRRVDVAPEDRRAMVGAAWIRAYALGHWDDVFAWLPDLRAAFPALAPDIDLVKGAWLPPNRRHLATRLALVAPGLVALPSWARPPGAAPQFNVLGDVAVPEEVTEFDHFDASDGNWWCAPEPKAILAAGQDELLEPINEDLSLADSEGGGAAGHRDVHDWTAEQAAERSRAIPLIPLLRDADSGELKVLASSGSATKRLAEDAIAWAQDRSWFEAWLGEEKYLPETLYLAVRATRYGCRRPADNSPWSKAAFTLLHRRFPHSDWATKTPYWYGDLLGER